MTDEQVIIAVGDNAAVAHGLGIPKSTVANWKARGIPWKWRHHIRDMAKKKRVNLPDNFLYEKALP